MQIKTKLKAGKISANHNTTVPARRPVHMKTGLKAGKIVANHNATVR